MIKDAVDKIRILLRDRSYAYKKVFKENDRAVKLVLLDLARFCRAHETTFHKDDRIHAALEGRKEVWMRIQEHLHLSSEQLMEFHKARFTPQGD